ncbi:LysR family transcriptional regulator [Lentilactobacillus parakefiri]|nr:LysR family transcriptional regulator [Lentilactobacillus parakefiri]GAW71713.1 LysR family transcriptional regulator [Lentilactobacillus parakefiri]
MNSKLLSFLEEIQAQGNMSKAAQALFVTQPYISRVIKNAEVNFGVKLIDRSSHPIQLTYAGERLLAFLQEENRLRANLDREMTHLSQFKYGHLTIASNEVVTNDLYKPVLVRFYNKYPNIHAQITRMTS